MQTLWKCPLHQGHISTQTKMRIYETAVASILLYSSETWVTYIQMCQLDSFNMKQQQPSKAYSILIMT